MSASADATDSPDIPIARASTGPASESAASTDDGSPFRLRAALEAGVVAGIVFLLLEVVASQFGAATPVGPARATLKGLLGVPAGQATSAGLVGTLAVHFGLALATTIALAFLIRRWKTYVATIFGLAYGGVLYTANVVIFTFTAPGPTIGSGLAIIANYIVFGMIAAWVYKRRQ
jgi:hypothetical protein